MANGTIKNNGLNSHSIREYWNANNNELTVYRLGWLRLIRFWNIPSEVLSQITLDTIDIPVSMTINSSFVSDRGYESIADSHATMVNIGGTGKITAYNQQYNLQGYMIYLANEYSL